MRKPRTPADLCLTAVGKYVNGELDEAADAMKKAYLLILEDIKCQKGPKSKGASRASRKKKVQRRQRRSARSQQDNLSEPDED